MSTPFYDIRNPPKRVRCDDEIFIQHSLPDLLSAHTARSLSCALTYEIIYNKYASQPQKYNFQSLRVRQLIESITDGHVVFVDAPCT